jgi:hypothetical protein
MSIYTIQGNKTIGTSNPNLWLYCSQKLENGIIYKSTNNYINYDKNYIRPNYMNERNVRGLQWNFLNW